MYEYTRSLRNKGWDFKKLSERWKVTVRTINRIASAPKPKDLDALAGLPDLKETAVVECAHVKLMEMKCPSCSDKNLIKIKCSDETTHWQCKKCWAQGTVDLRNTEPASSSRSTGATGYVAVPISDLQKVEEARIKLIRLCEATELLNMVVIQDITMPMWKVANKKYTAI
jgi:transposase-like protein